VPTHASVNTNSASRHPGSGGPSQYSQPVSDSNEKNEGPAKCEGVPTLPEASSYTPSVDRAAMGCSN
ncbi:MAG: hypothetical protein ACJATT_005044, partial [Myxococcota bacterium]